MRCFTKVFLLILTIATLAVAADDNLIESTRAREDTTLTTDPVATFWQGARPVYAEKSPNAELLPSYRTEIRTRWTKDNDGGTPQQSETAGVKSGKLDRSPL
jgi:hypothetical protein